MRDKTRVGFLIALCGFSLPISAIEYSIVSINASEVSISYRLNNRETAVAPPERSFAMAISSRPDLSCALLAQGEPADGGEAVMLGTKILGSGFAGSDYLQWFSFSPYRSGSALIPCKKGVIRVHYSSSIFSNVAVSAGTVKNGIVKLPIKRSLGKKNEFPLPIVPFRIGVAMEVDADGIYGISGADLQRIGVPLGDLRQKMMRLFCKNAEVPIYCTNSQHATMQTGDTVLFYGQFLRGVNSYYTQFSNTNVYWLTWESGSKPGLRIASISGAQRKDARMYQAIDNRKEINARDFFDTIHFEQDNDIRWLGNINNASDMTDFSDSLDNIDNWYWGFIGQDYASNFVVRLPSPAHNADAKARIRIGIMGLTGNPGSAFDHNLSLLLNDNPVGDSTRTFSWKGQTPYILETDYFPSSALKADSNTITFLRKSSGSDISCLNWIEVEYLRTFVALEDKIWLKNDPSDVGDVFQFEIKGFSGPSIDLWDIGSSRLFTDFTVKNSGDKSLAPYSVIFQDSLIKVNSYFVQTAGKRLSPKKMRIDTTRSAWDTLARADYIVVGVDSFLTIMRSFVEAYAKKGIIVALVDINDIYNAFSAGIRDPESVRSLIRYLFSTGNNKTPRYLLLAGDATHDLDKNRRERTLVPTHLSRVPGWGPSSNDGYFAAVDEDRFPALCVGRFPAENIMEMQTLVDKTAHALASPEPGPWRDNLVMLGGWENDFTQFNNTVTSQVIGPSMNILRMDADSGSPYYKNEFSASKTIADYINAGVYAINFNGHGGGNIWSDSRFFGYDDLDKLYNGQWGRGGRLPFIFSFTCLTGFFESAFYRSLGEEFVRRGKDGALGFFGASAYTSKQANLLMNRILLDYAVNGKFESVGELIRLTKINMLARYGAQYLPVVRQYNYLGDPALPWQLAPDSLKVAVTDSSLKPGGVLPIRCSCLPLSSGQMKLTVNADGKKWTEKTSNFSKGEFSDTIFIKDSMKTKSGVVRAFAWNESQQLRGWSFFAKDVVPVFQVKLDKETVHWGDTVFVSCAYSPPSGATNAAILCLYTIAQQSPAAYPQGGANETALVMQLSPSGRWISGPLPVAYSGRIGDILFLRFRIVYTMSDFQVSDTSRTYSFSMEGRPDLSFMPDVPRISWYHDSIHVDFTVSNAGNVTAPSFHIFYFLGRDNSGDTLGVTVSDSMTPGKIKRFGVNIPDSLARGDILFTACLNADHRFSEISFDNNCKTVALRVISGNIQSTTDSLFSMGRGLCIVPTKSFDRSHRLFLFCNPVTAAKPLRTESSWVSLLGDSVTQFSIGIRPALSEGDSLSWIFMMDSVSQLSKKISSSEKKSVFLFDSSILAWRYAQGGWNSSQVISIMHSVGVGPFALAHVGDVTPPQIRALVDGREIVFLDYAAKEKPFNILLNDPSGIVPSLISIKLNGKPLETENVSLSSNSSAYDDIAITAYPKKERTVDSLTVYAEDFAGNRTTSIFAYMPGEDLGISVFSCHPNPFTAAQNRSGNTAQIIRFAFLLTDVAHDVSITIYTIGGNAIWKWRSTSGIIGYQEVEWNGKTSDGRRIANGTYYAKLMAENEGKKAIKKIRIAKLEGY